MLQANTMASNIAEFYPFTPWEKQAIVDTVSMKSWTVFSRDMPEVWSTFRMELQKQDCKYRLYIYDEESKVASFFLEEKNHAFILGRRFVKPEYRKKHTLWIFCLSGIINLVDEINRIGAPKNIELAAAQKMVIEFFLISWFHFKTQRDKALFDEILAFPEAFQERHVEVADSSWRVQFIESVIFPSMSPMCSGGNYLENASSVELVLDMGGMSPYYELATGMKNEILAALKMERRNK